MLLLLNKKPISRCEMSTVEQLISQGYPSNSLNPEQYRLSLFLMAVCQSELDKDPIAEDTTYNGHRMWRNQVSTDQEASSYHLALIGLERVMQDCGGGEKSSVLSLRCEL